MLTGGDDHADCNKSELLQPDEVKARLSAVNSAYEGLWADFLQNRWEQARDRSAALLRILGTVPDCQKDVETWVTEADFCYIAGATNGNDVVALERAVSCYSSSLGIPGGEGNASARRMRAEAMLRLHRYEEAFAAFGDLASNFPPPYVDLEVAPFKLRHDAQLCERLGQLGRLPQAKAAEAAAALRLVASRVESVCSPSQNASQRTVSWPKVRELEAGDVKALQTGLWGQLKAISAPYPQERFNAWLPSKRREPLSQGVDWRQAEAAYASEGIVVIDDFFNPEALAELWDFAREAPCFSTVRRGYLGAFPADGNVHPLIISAALALEHLMPRTFAAHPLGLWWFFKYTEAGPSGIGIHADAAAVNVNIWLTPDEARRAGGGLDVYMQLPPDEAAVHEFNHDFATEAEEAAFRDSLLAAGGVRHVDYRRNRAVIFVSDLFHASEPFQFVDCENQPRVNLTLLFGDRTAARPCRPESKTNENELAAPGNIPSGDAAAGGGGGWDLFD